MPRKRVHELAKEWGVGTRQVLAQLESLKIHGKKAQSTLSEQEAESAHRGLLPEAVPSLVLGEEKVVAERMVTDLDQQSEQVVTAREEVRENRIRPNVIRRRRRVEVITDEAVAVSPESAPVIFSAPTVEAPLPSFAPTAFDLQALEPISVSAEPLKEERFPFDTAESTADSMVLKGEGGEPESSSAVPPLVEARAENTTAAEEVTEQEKHGVGGRQPAKPAQAPIQDTQIEEASGSEQSSPSENGVDGGPRSARVLGRIDLGKLVETRTPKPGDRGGPAPFPAKAGTAEPATGEGAPGAGKRKGKKS